jgi:hypothetical protein
VSRRADDPVLTVTLPRSLWVALLGSLGQRPYAEVAELIEEIVRQAGAQLDASEQLQAESPARAN